MKTLLAIVLASSTAQAAFVDRNVERIAPNGVQRAAIASWAQDVWPAIVPSTIERIMCQRRMVTVNDEGGPVSSVGAQCYALARLTLTAEQYLDAAAAGRVRQAPSAADIAEDGSSAENVLVLYGPRLIAGAPVTSLANVANSVFSIPAGALARIDFWKETVIDDDTGETTTRYSATAKRRVDLTATELLLCTRNGTCSGLSR